MEWLTAARNCMRIKHSVVVSRYTRLSLSIGNPILQLRGVVCHMGSQSVTCQAATRHVWTYPDLTPAMMDWLVLDLPTREGWEAELTCCVVLHSVTTRLLELGAEVVYVDSKLAPMLWRFTIVDDPGVDVFIVRDADSRLTPRDAAVVADWLRQRPETSAIFHCVRDHPSHTWYAVSGGLWGAHRALLARLFNNRCVDLISFEAEAKARTMRSRPRPKIIMKKYQIMINNII